GGGGDKVSLQLTRSESARDEWSAIRPRTVSGARSRARRATPAVVHASTARSTQARAGRDCRSWTRTSCSIQKQFIKSDFVIPRCAIAHRERRPGLGFLVNLPLTIIAAG